MRTIALRAIVASPVVAAAFLAAPPIAQAYPSGPCTHVGTVERANDGTYTVCNNNGWVHIGRIVCDATPTCTLSTSLHGCNDPLRTPCPTMRSPW